jgi:hypothetical protein
MIVEISVLFPYMYTKFRGVAYQKAKSSDLSGTLAK